MCKEDPAQAVLAQLRSVFADFKWETQDDGDVLTLHGLMQEFLVFWGRVATTSSEEQVKALAAILNDAVAQGGVLENAVDTCFLEHLSHVHGRSPLNKFLSPAARSLTR